MKSTNYGIIRGTKYAKAPGDGGTSRRRDTEGLASMRDNRTPNSTTESIHRGKNNQPSKLSEQQVAEIRQAYRPYHREYGAIPLAEKYGVTASYLSAVARGATWGDLGSSEVPDERYRSECEAGDACPKCGKNLTKGSVRLTDTYRYTYIGCRKERGGCGFRGGSSREKLAAIACDQGVALASPLTTRESDRFWQKVKKTDNCWEWAAYCHPSGYGTFRLRGRMEIASRVSWVIHYGDIPDDLFVCHTCDNRSCVNPAHLFLGTIQDNNRDRDEKNRCYRWRGRRAGENNSNAKLTLADVKQIRGKIMDGVHDKVIAAEFGVKPGTVASIRLGRSWTQP